MAELENPSLMPNLITYLSCLLQKVAESNDVNCRFQPQKVSVFHGLTRPTISIQSYLDRIYKYANCSPSCFIVAYIYLDRFAQKQPTLPINSFNVHRLLITSVMVAAKFMDDIIRVGTVLYWCGYKYWVEDDNVVYLALVIYSFWKGHETRNMCNQMQQL
ncbi:hypothetical protein CXB51_031796 [Gossypium anomalum]|uniref:Cyclin n=1 Tax=Gossypium anomalum TaxID=47600 RepID=A0A8J5Y4V1_9ROSI|nr:hypothetical protein CXB51_031796 [Gossypium anomalum]